MREQLCDKLSVKLLYIKKQKNKRYENIYDTDSCRLNNYCYLMIININFIELLYLPSLLQQTSWYQ